MSSNDCHSHNKSQKRPHPDISESKEEGEASIIPDASPELASVDFTQRISWGKYQPYDHGRALTFVEPGEPPVFTPQSPALCCHVHAISGRARATTLHLCPQPGQPTPRPVPTPMFMPVGTKGCLKGVEISELLNDLSCPIILANTYHLAIQPGTELIDEMGGLHAFQGLPKAKSNTTYNLLTDSGGFQMVSLVKLSQVTEEGVSFENPFQQQQQPQQPQDKVPKHQPKKDPSANDKPEEAEIPPTKEQPKGEEKNMLLLRPEDSIQHQNNISANIIMALDDVVSSVEVNEKRFRVATHRTLRWYDRCYKAHAKSNTQNLFPIVQGGLDTSLGGLREQCLAGFRHREQTWQYQIPGYAIGGLAGGEDKDDFWRVVDQCCRALPDDKPRYLMGVGYPLDLVVCTALGVDMYDCVYPTRTARFGVALVPGKSPGTLKLKSRESSLQTDQVIQDGCPCQACRLGISRARLYNLVKANNPLAVELITQHNITYMMSLVRDMREAILQDKYASFVRTFIQDQYPRNDNGGETCPGWVSDALVAAGIDLTLK